MDIGGGVWGLDLAFVRRQVRVVVVTEVHRPGTVLSEPVGARSANPQNGIRAPNNGHFGELVNNLFDGWNSFEPFSSRSHSRGLGLGTVRLQM